MAGRPDSGRVDGHGHLRLARPDLQRRLAAALDEGAPLLVAPAGFGKTVALQTALELRAGAVAWLACLDTDGDPGLLLTSLVAALMIASPGLADAFGDRLAAATEPVDPAAAVRRLLADLGRLLVDPLTVVFDDAERLAGSRGAAAILEALLGADVPRLRVAVAARQAPLRVARLHAAGRLTKLGPADLVFTLEDCAALLRGRADGAASAEAEALWTATEGWPLGAALAARAPAGTGAPPPRSEALAAYLDEELLATLPGTLRTAVVESSVVSALADRLVAALGLPDDLLEQLRALGVPLSAHHREDGAVALHPLVREFLLERLSRERPPARIAELHRRAAEALEAAGRAPEAVEHRLAAGDDEGATRVLARHGETLARTAPGSVARWLGELPDSARAAPELRLLEGRVLAGEGRLGPAVAPLREAVAGHAERGDAAAEWQARVVLADTLVIQERYAEAVAVADGFEASGAPTRRSWPRRRPARSAQPIATRRPRPCSTVQWPTRRERRWPPWRAACARTSSTSPAAASTRRWPAPAPRWRSSSARTRSAGCPTCSGCWRRSRRSAARTTRRWPPWPGHAPSPRRRWPAATSPT